MSGTKDLRPVDVYTREQLRHAFLEAVERWLAGKGEPLDTDESETLRWVFDEAYDFLTTPLSERAKRRKPPVGSQS